MKKKPLTLIVTVALLLTGCSSTKKDATTDTTVATTEITAEATTEITAEATTESTTEVSTEATEKKSLSGLTEYLESNNHVSGEQSEAYYQYIGAIGGCKYLDSNVEIYEFDESSDTYKSIIDTNEVSGLKVYAINGPFILIFSNDASDQSIIDAFNNY